MSYRHTQRRKVLNRYLAQVLYGDHTRPLDKQVPSYHLRQRLDSALNAARIAQHPLRGFHGDFARSARPDIRATVKALRARRERAEAEVAEAQTDAWKGR